MKTNFLKIGVFALALISVVACKENKEAEAAKEVAEAADTAVAYKVDASASNINWVGEKPTEKHTGTISLSDGEVSVNNGQIEAGKFTIDMKSITVTDLEGESKGNLEAHLMGTVEGKEDHFFNVETYPTATFELTGVSVIDGKNMVEGNLTIRNKTNNVSFPANVSMQGDAMMLESDAFTIDRTQWDVNYGSKSIFDDLGDKFISDDITLTITLKATKA